MIIGGYAVNFHGYVRNTDDLDVWVRPTNGNRDRLINALDEFGFETRALGFENFEAGPVAFHLGVHSNRVDFLTRVSGVEFEEAWPEKVEVKSGELLLNYISFDHLIRTKTGSFRHKDLNDLENLKP